MDYDVIVVGAGPAGIFTCYELMAKSPKLKVLLVDKGNDIYKRRCPILEKKIEKCPVNREGISSCFPACSITNGFGGAGAFSDGKFNITSEFGGWLSDYLLTNEVEELINYVDSINLKHGATEDITDPYTEEVKAIEKKGYAVGLKLLRAKLRHLGTEENLQILKNIYEELKNKIQFLFKTEVTDLSIENNKINGVVIKNETIINAKYVVVVPGRDGS